MHCYRAGVDAELKRAAEAVTGFMPEAEGLALCETAQEYAAAGPVLEVGSYCGKSAIYLAAGIRAARKLGINYPVLVTGMDGNCPAQRALQVQFYPSMVLLDREGNILQFQQGANDTTLGRIDRTIEKTLRDGDRRGGE